MEFIELLTVTTEKGEGVLLEECGRQYGQLRGIYVYLSEKDYASVHDYIDSNISRAENCKSNFKKQPAVIMGMLLTMLGYKSYTEYVVQRLGGLDNTLEYAKGIREIDRFLDEDDSDDAVADEEFMEYLKNREAHGTEEGVDGTDCHGNEASISVEHVSTGKSGSMDVCDNGECDSTEESDNGEAIADAGTGSNNQPAGQEYCSTTDSYKDNEFAAQTATEPCKSYKESNSGDRASNSKIEEYLEKLLRITESTLALLQNRSDTTEDGEKTESSQLGDTDADVIKSALLKALDRADLEDVFYTGSDLLNDILTSIEEVIL